MKVYCFTKTYKFDRNTDMETNYKITVGKFYTLLGQTDLLDTPPPYPDYIKEDYGKYSLYHIIDDSGETISINSRFFYGPEYWRDLQLNKLVEENI